MTVKQMLAEIEHTEHEKSLGDCKQLLVFFSFTT